MNKKARVFIFSGPSGSGKTTLYKRLLKIPALKGVLKKAVSVTTRRPRHNEKNHRDYNFVGRREFLRLKRSGSLLESQNVFGCLYGTSRENVESILKSGKNVLLVIDVKGEKAIKKIFPHSVSIFILPPSIAVLKHRLKTRSTEGRLALKKRLLIAEQEIRQSQRYDYKIVNDHLSAALRKLQQIILEKV